MSELKKQAQKALTYLRCWDRLWSHRDCGVIQAALNEIEPLAERDKALEELWAEFGDIPMNLETECMEEAFLGFPAGTHRETVWHWFDERHSRGVGYLLYQTPGLTKFRVRVSQLRYGDAEVEAVDEQAAKSFVHVTQEGVRWFDSEITDITVERVD